MSSILIGIIAILVGLLFCFRGVVAMRIVIAIWGAFVGFAVGAIGVAEIADEAALQNAVGWIVGITVAIAFGLLAYFFYAVAVIVAMTSIGYSLGVTVMVAFGVTWSWVIILVGVIIGALLAFATVAMNLPLILLAIFSSLGGASATVGGIMLLTNTIQINEFNRTIVVTAVDGQWWWYLIYLALVIAGFVMQARFLSRDRDLEHQTW